MATIEKRGDAQWRAKVRKKGFPTLTKTFAKKAIAERWARDVESSMDKGVFIDHREADQTTLSDILDRYEREVLPTKKSQKPVKFQIKLIKQMIGNHSLSRLNSSVIAKFRDNRAKEVSGETIRKDLLLIRRVIHAAVVDWGIQLPNGNPVAVIRLPSPSKARDRRLETGEEKKLLKAAKEYGGNLYNIIVFAIETAMRRGEIINMKWRDIKFDKNTLYIDETKTDSPRTIPLSKLAIEVLKKEVRNIDGFIWNIQPNSITQAFRRICKKAEIEGLRFHDLRHEATSRFFEKGFNIMEVSSITGHKDLKMLKRYTHLKAEDLVHRLQ
ncbi:MAG: site-specific integrase [Woeseiaceae bacterium]